MKNFAAILILSLAGTLPLFAAVAPPETKVEATAEEAVVPALELKHKSTFAADPGSQNPFWPIGWKPAAKVTTSATANDATGPDILPSAFLVSSITVDAGASFAIINGRAMAEGQVFGLQMGNQTFQITVKAIQDGQVILARRDQEIVAPLRRR